MEELIKNKLGLQVLTDTGWSEFDGVLEKGCRQTVVVATQTSKIICTLDHRFFDHIIRPVEARKLRPGTRIQVHNNIEKIVSIALGNTEMVYDLFNVKKNHRFYANGILVKNCEFIIADETLVNPMKLVTMESKDPNGKIGQVRVFKYPQPQGVYAIGWDPSLGTGGDPAAIQVFKLPELEQIAEWQHNKTDIQGQLRTLIEILKWLNEETHNSSELYWSVENNTIGEAALISIREYGEQNIPGTFVQEIRRAGQSRGRRGFNTTHKTKITSCMRLKNYVESDKMTIYSHNLLRELKNFVARGASFAAKDGETDDLVMATILMLRIVEVVMTWDANTYDRLANAGTEEVLKPMPIGFLN